jgi:hypothetical protein
LYIHVSDAIFTQNIDTKRQDEAAGNAQQIAKVVQEAQIFYPEAVALVQVSQIEPHQECAANLWRRPTMKKHKNRRTMNKRRMCKGLKA